MAVEPQRSTIAQEEESAATEPGPLAMLHGEERVAESPGAAGGRFVLTNLRVLYTGGSEDPVIFESARLSDIVGVRLERRSRDRRSAVWGIIGLLAAIAVWQVTRNETVGAIAAAIVGIVSIALLVDYWFRRPGMTLTFLTPGGPLGGQVQESDADAAQAFVGRFEDLRASSDRQAATYRPPSRPYGGMRHPLL